MSTTNDLKEDIAYVRAAAERAGATTIPSIYVLWAVVSLCGFALADFAPAPRWLGLFWLVAGPGGFFISAWLGYRTSRDSGQGGRRIGARWGLHWLAFMAAGALVAALVAAGQLPWAAFGSLVVLLMALSYFYAGLYLDRRMLAIGGVLAACYLGTLFIPAYQWTLAGVLVAGALVWQAILGARERDAAHLPRRSQSGGTAGAERTAPAPRPSGDLCAAVQVRRYVLQPAEGRAGGEGWQPGHPLAKAGERRILGDR